MATARLEVRLSDQVHKRLEALADAEGLTQTDGFHRALALDMLAKKQEEAGARLQVARGDQVETLVTIGSMTSPLPMPASGAVGFALKQPPRTIPLRPTNQTVLKKTSWRSTPGALCGTASSWKSLGTTAICWKIVASRRRPSGRISKIPHPLLLNDCTGLAVHALHDSTTRPGSRSRLRITVSPCPGFRAHEPPRRDRLRAGD